MNQGKIIKYSASAGSGKTHTLTAEYLLRLFANPPAYRKILAVTFTNKAAAEMKSRILDELSAIAAGKQTKMLVQIEEKLRLPPGRAEKMASALLSSILSDYSRFSVGTIDSFFQRVFRAFAREIGIQSNFSIYLDFTLILRDTVDDLIRGLNDNEEMRKWLVRYAGSLFEEGKPIDLAGSIYNLSETIFSEQFKLLPKETKDRLSDLSRIERFVSGMEAITGSFKSGLKKMGRQGVDILERNGVEDSMLRGGKNGIARYLRIVASGEIKEPYAVINSALTDDKWHGGGKLTSEVEVALSEGLKNVVAELAELYERDFFNYQTAEIILKNIYMAAILADVVKLFRIRTNSENSFVLADTGDLLMSVIGNDQTPFIYEKTGNEYDVFMLDEFQDTSMIQYNNFRPLIENSLAQGSDTLVVGDIKQSIYRWRNGDWSILGKLLEEDFGFQRIDARVLETNWRSLPEIVRFNNSLFTVLPQLLDTEVLNIAGDSESPSSSSPGFSFSSVYRDILQKAVEGREGGYVRISFLKSDEDGKAKEKVLAGLPDIIRSCQDDGYPASDIGILVRTKAEGSTVLDYLTQYREGLQAEEATRYNFSMLSGESLLVGNSPAVCFIVCTMLRIADRGNLLNRTEMLRYYLLAKHGNEDMGTGFALSTLDVTEDRFYPQNFREFMARAGAKPLFTLSEEITDFFRLNEGDSDMACLNYFHDQVLEFMNRRGSDLKSFTGWWLEQGRESSVTLSGEQDALRIMTIHKAKGLQFKIVIVPFLSWGFDQKSGNLMWVSPDEEPFNEAGAFPVGYGSKLEPTLFGPDYLREKSASFLDNLNLLYVAFTRAEERLYGFAYSRGKNDTGSILRLGLMSDAPATERTICLRNSFDEGRDIFETGSVARCTSGRTREALVPAKYPVYESSGRLKLRLYGRDLLKDDRDGLKSKIYYGTVLHDILGRIRYRRDLEEAVEAVVAEGYISEGMSVETRAMVGEMISRASVARWFDDNIEVMTEPEILTGDGDIRRPDRVVIIDGKISVIDYKFGEERSEHVRQIENYRGLLAGMGYDVDEACLWYVETDKIVRV